MPSDLSVSSLLLGRLRRVFLIPIPFYSCILKSWVQQEHWLQQLLSFLAVFGLFLFYASRRSLSSLSPTASLVSITLSLVRWLRSLAAFAEVSFDSDGRF